MNTTPEPRRPYIVIHEQSGEIVGRGELPPGQGRLAMSADRVAEGLTRQSREAIERLSVALEVARDRRDDAKDRHDAATWLLGQALVDGMTRDDVPEWVQDFRDSEAALRDAREAWQAARIEWYHARGMHASKNLASCCAPECDDA